MASAPSSRSAPGRLHGAQIAADIGRRQAEAAQPGNHDVREVLADAAAQRERHRRRGRHGGGADLVDEIGLDALHQLDRAVEHRPVRRKALARIVADLRIERDLPAREQKMRRRPRADVGDRERRVAHLLPGRRRGRRRRPRSRSTVTRAISLTTSLSCGWSSPIQVSWLPKKSWPSRRSTGAGSISSAAACTRWRVRSIGVSRST